MKILNFIISFVITIAVMPRAIGFSVKNKLLDIPKKGSIHSRPIPFTGGVIIFFIFFVMCALLGLVQNLVALLAGSLLIIAAGLYDDIRGLAAPGKLLMQLAASLIMICFGIYITRVRVPFAGVIELGVLSVPLTVLWTIFIINLVNIIDGLDGLAGGLCAIVLFVIFVFAQSYVVGAQLLVLLAATTGFLVYNFYPAKIFLGNNGSSFLGFLIAYFSLVSSQKSTITATLLIPCGILMVQILDIIYAVFRRQKAGVSIFKGDTKHFHHMMLNEMKDHRKTVLLFYLISIVLTIVTLRLIAL